ncbi:MAG: flagellar basal body-associated FliL family protein [Phycisphaerae bacterium]
MADDAGQAKTGGGGQGRLVTLLVVGALMAVEGVAVFAVSRMFAPAPVTAEASTGSASDADDGAPGDQAEIVLSKCRPTNKTTGKLITFSISVSGLVARDRLEEITQMVADKQSRLDDRVNYVVRSAEVQQLNEPELQTIKRRLKQEFAKVFGDDAVIDEVLITELLQSSGGL